MKGVDIRIDRANTPKEIQIASVDDIWKRKKKRMNQVRRKMNIYLKPLYRGSPDSTVFAHPGNRTIDKIVLFGD